MEPEQKNYTGLIIVVVVAILILGGGAWWFLRQTALEPQPAPTPQPPAVNKSDAREENGMMGDSNTSMTDDKPQGSVAPSTINVDIKNFSFAQKELRVKAGTRVIWTNRDTAGHTVTSDTGMFDSRILSQGKTFEQTFSQKGVFSYHCEPHPNMTAKVIVE